MKTLLAAASAILISGCGSYISQNELSRMQDYCNEREGVFEIFTNPSRKDITVICKDGTRTRLEGINEKNT